MTESKQFLPGCWGVMAALALLAACATPYQPMQQGTRAGGYQEEQLDEATYLLHFSGNGHSQLETVIGYWNRRALELCPEGYTLLEQEQNVAHAALPTDFEMPLDLLFKSQFIPHMVIIPHIVSVDIPYVYGKISCK